LAHSKPPPAPEHPFALIPPGTSAQLANPIGALTSVAAFAPELTFTATLSIATPEPV
jgi:hypothetical protein